MTGELMTEELMLMTEELMTEELMLMTGELMTEELMTEELLSGGSFVCMPAHLCLSVFTLRFSAGAGIANWGMLPCLLCDFLQVHTLSTGVCYLAYLVTSYRYTHCQLGYVTLPTL